MQRALTPTLTVAALLMWTASCTTPRPPASTADRPRPADTTAASPAPAPDAAPGLDLGAALPLAPDVRTGKLANGMTYYVRANQRPAARAELRLAVNAGSILEDENQQGLAHFVEHMAFNGTTRYEKQELVDYLELIGMRFGPDLNAYTGFDETVYMLQIPTDSAGMLETGLDILREWATNITFEAGEVDKERGVVIEEWRQGRGAGSRIQDQQLPILLYGSRYAERLPIGKVPVLESAPVDVLRRFYRDWYRPGLMAIVAVGDFDPGRIETEIRDRFETIPAAEQPRPRPSHSVPDHQETLFAIAGDPEATSSTISVVYKHPEDDDDTLRSYRQSLVETLYHGMLNNRLGELTQRTDPPYITGFSGPGGFVRGKEFYNLFALVEDGGHARALKPLLVEAERVRRYGFTETEFEREQTSMLRRMERAYDERDKTESGVFASEYVRNFLEEEPIPGIAYEYEMIQALLPTITLEEVDALADKWITDENRVILASAPEKDGVPLPTEAELLAVFDAVAGEEITPYEEDVSDAPLLADLPAPGTIVGTDVDEAFGVTRMAFDNGVEVVMKPTDFKNDQILFSAYSPGGLSLVPDDAYDAAEFASLLVGQSGVGDFGPIELNKKLAGKVVSIGPSIGSRSEGFSGSASPQDLETLLQLVHLFVTRPRADSTAYVSYKTRLGALLANYENSPDAAFRDTVSVTMSRYHPRRRPLTPETLDEMDLQTAFEVYQDRFADLSDFTFYFVGAFDVDTLTPLAATYLGSLPGNGREETARDEGVRPPTGVIHKEVRRGLEPKSSVQIIYTGAFTWSSENRRLINAMGDVLETKLREVLREDLSGTYSVSVGTSTSREPTESYRITIGFGCDPGRVEELTQTIFTQVDSLQTAGTTEKYVQKVREQTLRTLERNLRENGYWMSILQSSDQTGLSPSDAVEGPRRFMDALMPAKIQAAARQYLNPDNYVKVVLYPETFEQ